MSDATPQSLSDIKRTFQFQSSDNGPGETAARTEPVAATPRTPPSRRSGRLLLAGLMFAACSAGVATVWDSLLRYRAYGVVTGRIVDVSAPIDGVLQSVHVREGDEIREQTRLAIVADLQSEQQLERVADELKIAEARLHAEIARIQWQAQVQDTEMTRSLAEFHEGVGQVHETVGSLNVIRNELRRTQELISGNAAREVDYVNQTIREQAQKDKLAAVQKALAVLKERAETAASVPRLGKEQVAPLVAKVDMLLNETERIRRWISQGDLRAPVNGRILHRHHPAGEYVKSSDPLFSVIEDASLEIELFLPQEMTDEFRIGDTIKLKIEPFEELVPCEVTQIGSQHRHPPSNIEVFYRRDVKLLPVKVRPAAPFAGDHRLSVGAVAKLPHFGSRN